MWLRSMLVLKKPGNSLECQLIHFVTGINRVRLRLLELHPGTDATVNRIYKTFLVGTYLLWKRGKLHTVGLPRNIRKPTLYGKKTISEPIFLITKWFQTSVLESIGREKVLTPFWTGQSLELSKQLWLPTETVSPGSRLNSWKRSSPKQEENSLFSMITRKNPQVKNSQMNSSLFPTCTPTEEIQDVEIRTRKIRIYPNQNQKQILKQWLGASRYVYNKALAAVKSGECRYNTYELRDRFVTGKPTKGDPNYNVKPWLLKIPKDIRAGAVRDLVKGFTTNVKLFKAGKISRFEMRFRTRKKETSIEIPKSAIKIVDGKVSIYQTYLSPIRMSKDKYLKDLKISHDCRLSRSGKKWFIFVPCKKSLFKQENVRGVCSLDPGIRKFQTLYSEKETVKFQVNTELLNKLYSKLDLLRSLRDRKIIRKRREIDKRWSTLGNYISDMHGKIITWLCRNYQTVLIPIFESQEIGKKLHGKTTRRNLFDLKHYQFRMKLLEKAQATPGFSVRVCTEEYTSKTCTGCGVINRNLGSNEKFSCSKCKLEIDRDVNGSRNILIKWFTEHP